MLEQAYVGAIFLWSSPYLPMNFVFCNGQSLPISEYPLLFELIGNTFGGDGENSFFLPDLRSRVPIGASTNTNPNFNLTPIELGTDGGAEDDALIIHNHNAEVTSLAIQNQNPTMLASFESGTQSIPTTNCYIAPLFTKNTAPIPPYVPGFSFNAQVPDTQIAGLEIESPPAADGEINLSSSGTIANGKYANMQPFLAVNYIICINGLAPLPPQ